jgi:serine/threonine protein kinase
MDEAKLRDRIEELTGRPAPDRLSVFTDTTEFMSIWRGHVLLLEGRHFLVEGDMREGRFGVDDQPKFWVKKALDLTTGRSKILKLVFNEEFNIRIGLLRIRCYRDPDKEGRVLDLVRGDRRFMQGESLKDSESNSVRVVDFIRGDNLYEYLSGLVLDHETYYRTRLAGILERLLPAFEGIAFFHENGQHHGDIRNDHLIMDPESDLFRWIDFDLCQDISDFDVWSLGNVLLFTIGKGEHTFHDLAAGRLAVPPGGQAFTEHDASAFFVHRIMNLRKLFPWIREDLNEILMHFSFGTTEFYETTEQILADLRPVVAAMVRERDLSGSGAAS